jgi:hypothetical protein
VLARDRVGSNIRFYAPIECLHLHNWTPRSRTLRSFPAHCSLNQASHTLVTHLVTTASTARIFPSLIRPSTTLTTPSKPLFTFFTPFSAYYSATNKHTTKLILGIHPSFDLTYNVPSDRKAPAPPLRRENLKLFFLTTDFKFEITERCATKMRFFLYTTTFSLFQQINEKMTKTCFKMRGTNNKKKKSIFSSIPTHNEPSHLP